MRAPATMCRRPAPVEKPPLVPKRKILLVGWDSADWRLINPLLDAGMMPALSGVIERGAMGNLAAVEPVLSPLIWTSLATGKLPHKHGVLGFVEPDPHDRGRAQRRVGHPSVPRRCGICSVPPV